MVEIESAQGIAFEGRKPLITVAMPIYNAGEFLRLAVLSVVSQTFSDWELLIIDDGSTDNALAAISDIVDQRIHVIHDGNNRGLGARLNEAIDLAQGKYFARMDQDDVSFPERFEYQVRRLEAQPELDLVAVRSVAISGKNELLGVLPYDRSAADICAKPWRGFYLAHPTWMGRTDWFRKHRYATPAPYFCEDQEFLLRTYESSNFDIIPMELFAYRLRDGVAWKKLIKTRCSVLQVQFGYFLAKGQMVYLVLALNVFFGRLLMDIIHFVLNKKNVINSDRYTTIDARWKLVLDGLKTVVVSNPSIRDA